MLRAIIQTKVGEEISPDQIDEGYQGIFTKIRAFLPTFPLMLKPLDEGGP